MFSWELFFNELLMSAAFRVDDNGRVYSHFSIVLGHPVAPCGATGKRVLADAEAVARHVLTNAISIVAVKLLSSHRLLMMDRMASLCRGILSIVMRSRARVSTSIR